MLPVAPLPFDDFGRAQIEGVLVSTKVLKSAYICGRFIRVLQHHGSCL